MSTNKSKSPIDTASQAQATVFIIYICALVIFGLVTAGLTVWLYKAGNAVQDAAKADADARIEEAKKSAAAADQRAAEANERAATANEAAGRANESAGKANESAGQANERAEALERGNLVLRTDLNKAAGEVAALQKEAADAKAAQQRVETELAKQQERAAIAERSLLELRQHLAQRVLTGDQKAALIEALAACPRKPRIPVIWVEDSSEIATFGEQIFDVVRAAGWDTDPGTAAPPWEGNVLTVEDPNNPPESALLLVREFSKIGLTITITSREGGPKLRTMSGTKSLMPGPAPAAEPRDLLNLWIGERLKIK